MLLAVPALRTGSGLGINPCLKPDLTCFLCRHRNLPSDSFPPIAAQFNLQLATAMRGQVIEAMRQAGHCVVAPTAEQTKGGCVQDHREAELCAELFRRERVAGIVIAACNFGDEQSAAATVRRAGLNVPVLLFGCQEDEPLAKTTPYRRNAFCGLLSLGEAMRQTGAQYSVARRPIGFPADRSFADDLDWFARVCRVVNGVRNARYGQVGTRPNPFCTCRCDEKQLQRLGAATVVIDMAEVIAAATAIDDADPQVAEIVASIQQYADTSGVLPASVVRSAKLELFLRRWRKKRAGCPGDSVLDGDPAALRRVRLHDHEPLLRRGPAGGLRSRRPGSDVDARLHLGLRRRRCLGRLEQSPPRRR